jgi:uncharacterized membrane protein YfhO
VVKTSQETKVVINTFYFPGWQVLINGEKTKIDYESDKLGRLVFKIPPGEHKVVAKFSETPLRLTADLISVAGFLLLILIPYKKIKNQNVI